MPNALSFLADPAYYQQIGETARNKLADLLKNVDQNSSIWNGIKDAANAPLDAYQGKMNPTLSADENGNVYMDNTAPERAMNVAGMVMGGGGAASKAIGAELGPGTLGATAWHGSPDLRNYADNGIWRTIDSIQQPAGTPYSPTNKYIDNPGYNSRYLNGIDGQEVGSNLPTRSQYDAIIQQQENEAAAAKEKYAERWRIAAQTDAGRAAIRGNVQPSSGLPRDQAAIDSARGFSRQVSPEYIVGSLDRNGQPTGAQQWNADTINAQPQGLLNPMGAPKYQDALEKARLVQNRSNTFDIEAEKNIIAQNGDADLSSIFSNPKLWDSENEETTQAGLDEMDRIYTQKAVDNLRLPSVDDISSLDDVNHKAQYEAMKSILDEKGIPYQDVSSAQSKYLEVGGKKIRFADHSNMVNDSAVRGLMPIINVAPGEYKFSDALNYVEGLDRNGQPAGQVPWSQDNQTNALSNLLK